MVRLIISFVIQLASNALGLIVAAAVLDKMEISGTAFLVAVVIFTLVYMLAQPFFTQLALSTASALRGGVALVATLVGLIVTSLVSDGLEIDGSRDLDRGDRHRLDRLAARRADPAADLPQEPSRGRQATLTPR